MRAPTRIERGARLALRSLSHVAFLPPLLARLVIGQAFVITGLGKLRNLAGTTEFFAGLGIPFPGFNAAFVGSVELFGGAFLVLGLLTRVSSFLLAATMAVALYTADRDDFADAIRGIIMGEKDITAVVPFVYLLMLLWLLVRGPGSASLDLPLHRLLKLGGVWTHPDFAGGPHVVIIGGGFGGLSTAQALAEERVRVTLIDRRNHHLFQPLLYQVASAALNPSDIAVPIREVLSAHRNTTVLLGDVQGVDTRAKKVVLADGEVAYDYLVVATGATHSYFGHDEWARHAPGLKSIEDALDIRRRVLLAYETAERTTDPSPRRSLLTFVVVGAGPTGVELAGALAEIARDVMGRDFRRFDSRTARVVLVEAGPRILPALSETLSAKAKRQLEGLGVEVATGTAVTSIDETGVSLGERRIDARTVLWGAGVQASPLAKSLGVPLDRAGRVMVEPDLTVPGAKEVFVIGDLAAVKLGQGIVPGVAPAAAQEGGHAARNLLRAMRGEPMEPYTYFDKGSMATIGREMAVAEVGRFKAWGFPAWLMWLFIHVLFLVGYRNRFTVLAQWSWMYITVRRGSRLITGQVGPLVGRAARTPGALEPASPGR